MASNAPERDPRRVDRINGKLVRLWQRYPGWRLCQLVVNVAREASADTLTDPFYIEDDRFEAALDQMLERP